MQRLPECHRRLVHEVARLDNEISPFAAARDASALNRSACSGTGYESSLPKEVEIPYSTLLRK